jgi:hypothetical protein
MSRQHPAVRLAKLMEEGGPSRQEQRALVATALGLLGDHDGQRALLEADEAAWRLMVQGADTEARITELRARISEMKTDIITIHHRVEALERRGQLVEE